MKITDQYGTSRSVTTDVSGAYLLDAVGAGETYVIAVAHKRYRFPNSPALVNVIDQIAGLDFISAL